MQPKKITSALISVFDKNGLEPLIKEFPMAKFIGVDIHLPDLNKAKESLGDKVDFINCDCLEMKLPNDCVNIVISNQVIEHIQDYNKYL